VFGRLCSQVVLNFGNRESDTDGSASWTALGEKGQIEWRLGGD
jgi:hypothetical protein